jgi:hypothetical protein
MPLISSAALSKLREVSIKTQVIGVQLADESGLPAPFPKTQNQVGELRQTPGKPEVFGQNGTGSN